MKTKIILLSIFFSIPALFSCNGQKGKGSVSLKSQADSVAYSIGVSIGQNMKRDGLDSLNVEILSKGLRTALQGDSTAISQVDGMAVIQTYMAERQKRKSDLQKAGGVKFLAENKSKPGVKTTPSGLQYIVIKEGTGPKPMATDTVTTHYHGTLIDGTVFDSSVDRGQPTEFPVNAVIPGWTEALQMMNVGSKWKLFIPSELAYGERQAGPNIGPNSTLIFEVELLGIKGK